MKARNEITRPLQDHSNDVQWSAHLAEHTGARQILKGALLHMMHCRTLQVEAELKGQGRDNDNAPRAEQ